MEDLEIAAKFMQEIVRLCKEAIDKEANSLQSAHTKESVDHFGSRLFAIADLSGKIAEKVGAYTSLYF